MQDFKLYLILDLDSCGKNIISIARQAVKAGVDIIQLRAKRSSIKYILKVLDKLKPLLFKYNIPLIINDRADLTKLVDADGVHLGQDDLPIKLARKLLGPHKTIGVSCHNIQQIKLAQNQGADYISLGPIFATPTKPESKPIGTKLIRKVLDKIKIPFVVIGGINQKTIQEVIDAGATRVALCRAICQAKEIRKTTQKLKSILSNN